MTRAVLVVLVACGGSSIPKPPPAATTTPRPTAVVPPPTCADVAAILRGTDAGDNGAERERAIEETCRQFSWPVAVLDCVATQPSPDDCVAELTGEQRNAWMGVVEQFAPRPQVTCDVIVNQKIELLPPPVGHDHPERGWVLDVRRDVVAHECEHGWSQDLLDCLDAAIAQDQAEQCVENHLDQSEADELIAKLSDVRSLARRIAAARSMPETIGCKQVVAAHYAGAKWKGKLDGFKAADRKKMIAKSRELMRSACTKDTWSELLRACIVEGGERTCFEQARMGLAWGYPAAGTVTSLGMRECDEYAAAIKTIMTCDKLPQESRDALKRSFDEMQANIASRPVEERAKLASGCKAGSDALAAVASSTGC